MYTIKHRLVRVYTLFVCRYLGTKYPIADLWTVSNVINSLCGTEMIVALSCVTT